MGVGVLGGVEVSTFDNMAAPEISLRDFDIVSKYRAAFCDGRIFIMLDFLLERKIFAFSLAGAAVVLLGFIAWRVYSLKQPSPGVERQPVLQFDYCGAELDELCLLSFGRDVNGNSIINLFVPDRDFPDFYLNISRFNGTSVYVCIKNEEMPTSVLCMGDVINLNERIEINIMSAEDYQLLAKGTFNLTAILISSQAGDFQTPRTGTPIPSSPTQTFTSGASEPPASTLVPTSSPSYPNYP